jgi:DNA adenine methylase Dam
VVTIKNKFIKSPLNYMGGKYKLLPQIIPLFPDNINTFVDLFAGGLNVGANVVSNRVVANDKIKEVTALLSYLKEKDSNYVIDEIDKLIDEYGLSKTSIYGYDHYGCNSNDGVGGYNKEKYLKLRDDYNNGNRSGLMFFMLCVFCFNNMIRFNAKREFNMPVNNRDFNKSLQNKAIKFIDKLKQIDVSFTNKDFRELDIGSLKENDFVYCDPPYLITVASYNEFDKWTEDDENDLYNMLDKLNDNGIRFALSNVFYNNDKTNNILIEWSKKYI